LALFDKINLIYETINNIKVKVVNAWPQNVKNSRILAELFSIREFKSPANNSKAKNVLQKSKTVSFVKGAGFKWSLKPSLYFDHK
jgi:hypothetical protein